MFNNESDGSFTANTPYTSVTTQYIYDNTGNSASFINAGTFTNNAGAGNTTELLYVGFNNSNIVNVNTGTLDLEGYRNNETAGTFFVPTAGTLQFGGAVTNLTSSIGTNTTKAAGAVDFSGGTTTVLGAFNTTGNLTVNISGNAVVDFDNHTDSFPYLNLSGNGQLEGSAAVTVTATTGTALTWTGNSHMGGAGSTTLNTGATMSLGGDNASQYLDYSRTFFNQGTVNWLSGSYAFWLNNGAVFNNEAGATFNANTPNSTTQYIDNNSGSSGTFINAGTFNNNAGTGNTTEVYNVLFNNSKTVNATSGDLLLDGGGTDTSAGTFFIPTGGTLEFGGGVTSMASAIGSSTTQAAGTLAFSGGTHKITGSLFSTGNFTVNVSGGFADFDNKTDSFPYLNLSGNGELYGTAAITVTATTGTALTWTGNSTMGGSGSTTLNTGVTMSLGGDAQNQYLDNRTFNNKGTVNWLNGSYVFWLNNGAVFNNLTGATFNANTPNSTTQYIDNNTGPAGTFINSGTFTNAAGTGNITEVYNVLFNNKNTVNANTGTLLLDGGGSDSGTFYIPSGATLQFGGGVTNLASAIGSSTNKAAGTLAFSGGTTVFNGSGISSAGNFTIDVSGGFADIEKNLTIPDLVLTGGTLYGSGNITVNATKGTALIWNGYSTMSGVGSITVNTGSTASLGGDGTYQTLDGRTFNNKGTVNWLSGSYLIYLNDGAVFNNLSGATFNANTPSSTIQYIDNNAGPAGTFSNAGTFNNNATASNTTEVVNVLFNNSKTVNANTGTLLLDGGGSDTSAGTFFIPTAGTLNFGGGVATVASAIGSSTNKAAGTLAFSGGTTILTGVLTDTGNFTVAVSGGVAEFDNTTDSIPYLTLSGGGLYGSANITVTATTGTALTWYGSNTYIEMLGSLSLNTGATASLGGDGQNQFMYGGTFNNKGTVNWLSGSNGFYLDDGAVFNNQAGATFNANTPNSTTQYIYNSAGSAGTFLNAGTFNNNATTGNTTEVYNVLFNNSASVNANTGTLLLLSGGTDTSAGTFFIPTGGTLDFGGDVTNMGSAIGSGVNKAQGTLSFTGGTTIVTGAVNDTGNFTVAISNNGIANFDNGTDSLPYLTLANGTLTGSAAITVTATTGNALTWNNYGVMSGAGSTTLAAGTTMALGGDGSYQTLDARTFNNLGTVNWTAGYYFYLDDGAVFNNQAGANFNANTPNSTNQYIYDGSGATPTFNNAGTFTNAAGAGNTTQVTNYVLFNNSGTVNANSGTLLLGYGGTDTSAGSFVVPAAGALQFSGVTSLASSVGTSGSPQAGTVTFAGGTTDVNGNYNVSGSTNVTGGLVEFTPASTLTSLGSTVTISGGTADISPNVSIATLNLTGGTLTGSGTVTVTSALTWKNYSIMSGTGATTLNNGATMALGGDGSWQELDARTFNNNLGGTVNWTAGYYFYMDDGAVFNNSGTFNASVPSSTNQYIYDGSGASGAFNNSGTFNTAAGSGNTTEFYYTAFNNTGTANTTSGTLLLYYGGGTSTGSFAVSSGATLEFDGGVNNLNSSPPASVTGAGNVTVVAGETDFAGTYNVTGATSITGGTANFLNGGTTGTFSNSGGTVNLATGTTFKVNTGDYTQSGGSTYLNGGTLAVTAGNKVNIEQSTYLVGPGAITGNLSNAGYLYVGGGGNLAGTLSVSGNFTQTSTGVLYMNVGGTTAGTQYDQLTIGGSATLGGTLQVSEINGFNPASGTFTLLTYASVTNNFSSISLPGGWTSNKNATTFTVTA